MDRDIFVNRFLISDKTFQEYKNFESAFFALYQGPGKDANLKIDTSYLRAEIGDGFKEDWMSHFAQVPPEGRTTQIAAYNALMKGLAAEIRGER
jgi:hypothetical protein